MKRSTFVATAIAGIALPSVASSALSPIVSEIETIERWSTGKIAVVAQRFDDVVPFITYREKTVVPAASTIKLLILMTLFKQADSDARLLGRKIVISASNIVGGSEIYERAIPGARYEVDKLAHAMIAQSDNTASNTLIGLLGFERINHTASVLGLTATRLGRTFSSNPPARRIALNHTCAGDLAVVALDMTRGARDGRSAIISQAGCRRMLAYLSDQEDHTKIGGGLPSNTRLANKTGEVSHVRNDVGIVNPGKPDEYVLAVMAYNLDADGRGDEAVAKVTRVIDPLIRAPRTASARTRLSAS
jgi:beta-lactamase class A